jgi:hypothetical protein
MAAVPTAGAGFNFGAFAVQLGASYLLGRATAQDGPRLGNLGAAGGELGVTIPRIFGGEYRATGILLAQADIKETEHTVEDYSELVGAATGAVQGFMMGGPVGAAIGAVAGGLLGAATPDQKYYTYSDTFALLFADRTHDDPIEGIPEFWAAGKRIFKASASNLLSQTIDEHGLVSRKFKKNRWFKSLTIYGGGPNQPIDPVLAAAVGEDTAYRGWAIAVFEDLQLAKFGQTLPAVEGLVVAKQGQTLAEVAEAICSVAGIDVERRISTTALTGFVVGGYGVTAETNCWDGLRPLLPVHRVDAAEVAGQVRFYRRGLGMRATIPREAMGGHVFGDDAPALLETTRDADVALPKETSVSFADPARDYQTNTKTSKRSEGDSRSNISLTLAMTLTADEGATAAATIHWDACLGRTKASFTLTDRWIGIEPGVCYGLPIAGQVLPYRITMALRGANGIIEVEAVSDESVVYQGVASGSSGEAPTEEPTDFPETRLIAMDMPILEDAHDDFGFYAVLAGGQPYWERGKVQASGNGTVFATIADSGVANGATIGDVVGTLAAGSTSGLDNALDMFSVLTVVLLHDMMTLTSATDAQLDAFANFAFVGKNGAGEYLQFKTATKVAPRTWALTGLRRGRKGTDHAIGGHGAGEEFALLGKGGVFRIVYANDDAWGVPLTLRGVTLNDDGAEAELVAFTNSGEGKRPYSVINVEGAWDGGYNLAASFDRRSRLNSGAVGEATEAYEIDILGGGGVVVRTIAVAAEAFVYTAVQATADGLAPGALVKGRIYQISAERGRGHPRPFTLVGPIGITSDTSIITADSTVITADRG